MRVPLPLLSRATATLLALQWGTLILHLVPMEPSQVCHAWFALSSQQMMVVQQGRDEASHQHHQDPSIPATRGKGTGKAGIPPAKP